MSPVSSSLSFWEKQTYFAPVDILVVGAGLSGLWSAYCLKKRHPSLAVTILERGLIPTGASTRNAGFACFGSLTELMHDVATTGEDKMVQLVSMRYQGLQKIIKTFDTREIEFSLCGGYELIASAEKVSGGLEKEITVINRLLANAIPEDKTFSTANHKITEFGLSNVESLIENKLEGYLHPGRLCQALSKLVHAAGVNIMTGINVNGYAKTGSRIAVNTNLGYEFRTTNLLLCTNAFTPALSTQIDVIPARGQMLLTGEIPGLALRGAFHADEGFYYFRNLGNRVLLGGARNTDFAGETSTNMVTNEHIQAALEQYLRTYIITSVPYVITDRWSGIMAMGGEKMPIVKEIEPNVYCAVRMSGMGVALTPVVGEMVADFF